MTVPFWVAGLDEAGRGPLAGPVVAAAVVLHPARPIPGLADSKTLSAARREHLAVLIREQAQAWALGMAEAEEIVGDEDDDGEEFAEVSVHMPR